MYFFNSFRIFFFNFPTGKVVVISLFNIWWHFSLSALSSIVWSSYDSHKNMATCLMALMVGIWFFLGQKWVNQNCNMFYTSNLLPNYGLPVISGNILRLIHYWRLKWFKLRKLNFMHHCVPKCFRLQWTLCTIMSTFSLTGTFGAAQSLETVRKLSTKLNPEEGSKSTYFLF